MNNLLDVKPIINQNKNPNKPAGVQLDANETISVRRVERLLSDIDNTIIENNKLGSFKLTGGYFLTFKYKKVIPKSNRVMKLFKNKCNDKIIGAKYVHDKFLVHYNLSEDDIKYAMGILKELNIILDSECNGEVNHKITDQDFNFKELEKKYKLQYLKSKSAFLVVLRDIQFIEKAFVFTAQLSAYDSNIVSLFNINNIDKVLDQYDISDSLRHGSVISVDRDTATTLYREIPYLVSMGISNVSKISNEIATERNKVYHNIHAPTTEPVIGVIDTNIYPNQYYDSWVEIDERFSNSYADEYEHGSQIISLLIDAEQLNPNLVDNCGKFRIKLFPLITKVGLDSFKFIKELENIIVLNPKIKVWNLSLGSDMSIRNDYVSIEAALLDELQEKYSIIFIVAATNKTATSGDKIGAPADSLNSLVVASVGENGLPSFFNREGSVLSFFHKPDLSYYGENIKVHANGYDNLISGTSFAAALITRKVAFLIYKLNLSREVTKALLIDNAIKWQHEFDSEIVDYIGLGIVDKDINDLLKTNEDEIKFFIDGISDGYDSNFHNLPIPHEAGLHNVKVKAVLTYFPKTNRYQGVDYTSSNLDLQIGRTDGKKIRSIDKTKIEYCKEHDLRKKSRKWDNTKFKVEKFTTRGVKTIGNGYYGVSLKSNERLSTDVAKVRFGLLITVKSTDGTNKIVEFYKRCQQQGWLINEVKVEDKIRLYNVLNEHIILEE